MKKTIAKKSPFNAQKAHFFLIMFCMLMPSIVHAALSPNLAFSDIESGPATGNSDPYGNGTIVTLWGNNLGSSQGTSQVYFRDSQGTARPAGHVYYWKNADGQLPSGPANLYESHRMQEIAFSIPSGAAQGAGEIYVNVNGIDSTTLPFTVRSGNIYFVKTTGSDTAGNGSWNSPWKTLNFVGSGAKKSGIITIRPGDVIYANDGVTEANELAVREYLDGTAGSPFSMIAYPNSAVIIYGEGIRNYQMSGDKAEYWNFAKFSVRVYTNGIQLFNEGRIVGNEITNQQGRCADGAGGAISGGNQGMTTKTGGAKIIGNYIHDYGCDSTSALHHVFYISNRGGTTVKSHELAWHYLKDNKANAGLHIYDQEECGDFSGPMNVHHNVVLNQRGYAFDIGGGCNSGYTGIMTMDVNVYNNLFINTGIGPAFINNGAFPSRAINVQGQSTSHVYFYHNTIYGYSDPASPNTKLALNIWHKGSFSWQNNLVVDTKNLTYASDTVIPVVKSNNLWYNGGDGNPSSPPSWDVSPLTSNPLFTDPSNNDFALQSTSPAIDNGVNAGITTDLYGNPRDSNPDIGAIEFMSGAPPPACIDTDGDGYGAYCVLGVDCNDNDAGAHSILSCSYDGNTCGNYNLCIASCPVIPQEVCGDGVDNDCNSQTDEGCPVIVNSFFQESNGRVVFEAENYDNKIDRSSKSWVFGNSILNFSSTGYMAALPNTGDSFTPNSSELSYNINFTSSGIYYLWVRGYAANDGDNSCHVGFDSLPQSSGTLVSWFLPLNTWAWSNSSVGPPQKAYITVSSAGIHKISLWMREDGFIADKIVLEKDANYIPTGLGPQESQRISMNTTITCADNDHDGYNLSAIGCGSLFDCNDNDANINPSKTEICGNGVDENCDGNNDDICPPNVTEIIFEDDFDDYTWDSGFAYGDATMTDYPSMPFNLTRDTSKPWWFKYRQSRHANQIGDPAFAITAEQKHGASGRSLKYEMENTYSDWNGGGITLYLGGPNNSISGEEDVYISFWVKFEDTFVTPYLPQGFMWKLCRVYYGTNPDLYNDRLSSEHGPHSSGTPPDTCSRLEMFTKFSGNGYIQIWGEQFPDYRKCPRGSWAPVSIDLSPHIPESNLKNWHRYMTHIKLNTAGNSDGLIEVYIDDILMSSINNASLVNTATEGPIINNKVNAITIFDNYFQTAHGMPPNSEVAIYMDDLVISTTYVPLGYVPGGNQTCADSDYDGFNSTTCGGSDCDDNNASIKPGATEFCGNSIDENCDGLDLQCNKADIDKNNCVDSNELSAFVQRWFKSSADVSMRELVSAIKEWKRGC